MSPSQGRRASSLLSLLDLWLGFRRRVGRAAYAATGFGLLALKYVLDNLIWAAHGGEPWTPVEYLNPFLTLRQVAAAGDAAVELTVGLFWLMLAVSIPFLWIGVSMTARRAVDAGLPQWLGLLFFFPFVNYLLFLGLCLLPSRPAKTSAGAPPPVSALAASLAGAAVGLGMVALSAAPFVGVYGMSLFLGTPFVMGYVAVYVYDRHERHRLGETMPIVLGALGLAASALLLFALEGAICIAMAALPALLLAFLGALLGRSAAASARMGSASVALLLVALPLGTASEGLLREPRLSSVTTVVEVAAPPEKVWRSVVAFPDLPPPRRLLFRAGIAYPVRARIVGEGVGALRTCEFSTGAFLEPITAWEAPRLLAFDVVAQPEPMREISPYREIWAPHLGESLVVERGEFRLERLPGGRTRLAGTTWYRLAIFPESYWTLWSDAIVGAIHARVLEQIRTLAETG